jgi:hypothetical protein
MEPREYPSTPSSPLRSEYLTPVAPANRRRISWGAIFAGTLVAIAVQLLLTLLGLAIGAWAINPAAGAEGMQGIGIGAGIWALLSFIIALFSGGWVAGRMSGLGSKLDGLLEGIIVWGAVTVLTFFLLTTTVGRILGGAAGLAGNMLPATAQEQMQNPQDTLRQMQAAIEDPQIQRDADETAKQVGESLARGTAAGSFWAFLALLLGAAAAAFAGRIGSASSIHESDYLSTAEPR